MSELLGGRRVAITGAASGIGRATLERALDEGATVAALDLLVDELEASDAVLPIRCDVADPTQVSAAFDQIADAFGGLDGLVTAAGIGSEGGDCVETPLSLWERMLAVNLTGVFLASRAAVPLLRVAGRASVVHVASQLGLVGTVGSPAYCASKGGVISFGRAMALDHAAEGIRVNVVCPGPVDTPMFAASSGPENIDDLVRTSIPLGRIGRPSELAAVITFLLSDESSFLTGSVIAADGGWTAR
jgi:meso-butanediol dehydrogenase/(S,S)-butanediol dehydrogenase/diacetyl reductase